MALTWFHHVAAKAVAMMQTQRMADHRRTATQLAMFGPEFGRWHFVPFSSGDKVL